MGQRFDCDANMHSNGVCLNHASMSANREGKASRMLALGSGVL